MFHSICPAFEKCHQFFHDNFRLKWIFLFLDVASKRSSSDLSEYALLHIKKYFFIYENQVLGKEIKKLGFFMQFFFKFLPKFTDFINSDDCIGKITSKSIRMNPVFLFFIKIRYYFSENVLHLLILWYPLANNICTVNSAYMHLFMLQIT